MSQDEIKGARVVVMDALDVMQGITNEGPRYLARHLVYMLQCGNCDKGLVPGPCPDAAKYPRNTSCTVAHYIPCPNCHGSGRLDGKALEAMARAFVKSFLELEDPDPEDIADFLPDLTAAIDAYLKALQEDTDE